MYLTNLKSAVFTFAGAKNASDYPIALEKRTELIRKEIAKYTGIGIANNVPSVVVDNKSEITPDGEKGLGELYTQIYARISAKGAVPFLLANVERIKRPEKEREVIIEKIYEPVPTYAPIELNQRQAAVVRNKTNEVLGLASAGASVGAVNSLYRWATRCCFRGCNWCRNRTYCWVFQFVKYA